MNNDTLLSALEMLQYQVNEADQARKVLQENSPTELRALLIEEKSAELRFRSEIDDFCRA